MRIRGGVRTGPEGRKVWTVRTCDCALCRGGEFVAVHEPASSGVFTAEELAADPRLNWRHLNTGSVYQVGRMDVRNAD